MASRVDREELSVHGHEVITSANHWNKSGNTPPPRDGPVPFMPLAKIVFQYISHSLSQNAPTSVKVWLRP